MGIFDGFAYGIKEKKISDAPEWKGYRFEKYVYVESLFDPKYFTLVEKTHSFREYHNRIRTTNRNQMKRKKI